MASISFIRIRWYIGSNAKYKLFCLNLMHRVKTQRSGELFVNIFNFYVVIIKNYKVKKYLTNFRKFPERLE